MSPTLNTIATAAGGILAGLAFAGALLWRQQQALQAQISKIVAHTPLATVADITRHNLESLAKVQESMLNALLPRKDRERDEDDKRP